MGSVELVVHGFVANVGVGLVPWFSLSSLVWIVFILPASGPASRFLCTLSDWIFWGWSLGKSNVENWFAKTFSCNPDWSHVSSGNLLSETSDNLPLLFDSTSWKSPESFVEFICSCICCNWEVSCWIVSWFSLNFCTETSSTHCSWALFISPISCILRIWVFRRTFSFTDKSSCSRTCSLLDSTNPYCASCTTNLWLPFVVVVHRCTYWGTRHEVLASPGLILPDWASDPCYLQKEILSNSTG